MNETLTDAHDHGNCELCDRLERKAEATERTLARAQRIIGSLHIERADLIERIAALVEAQEAEAEAADRSEMTGKAT